MHVLLLAAENITTGKTDRCVFIFIALGFLINTFVIPHSICHIPVSMNAGFLKRQMHGWINMPFLILAAFPSLVNHR